MTFRPLIPSALAEPTGWESHCDYRQFSTSVTAWLTNLSNNPTQLATNWANAKTGHSLLLNSGAGELATFATNLALGTSLGVRIYPAIRLTPSVATTIDDLVNPSFWVSKVADVAAILAARSSSDPRIGLDIENYGDGIEPTENNLIARGYSTALFRSAFQPVLDVLARTKPAPIVVMYPMGALGIETQSQIFLSIAETLGVDYVHPVWEMVSGYSTFAHQRAYRQHRLSDWVQLCERMRQYWARLDIDFGTRFPKHRMMIDSAILRTFHADFWSNGAIDALGPIRPVLYDETRNTTSLGTPPNSNDRLEYGKPTWAAWTDVSSVNDAAYWWDYPDLDTINPTSVGSATMSIVSEQYRANGAGGLPAVGACVSQGLAGMKLDPASAGSFTYGVFRDYGTPTSSRNWTRHYRFYFRDLSATHAFGGESYINYFGWQWEFDQATGKVFLRISTDSPRDVSFSPVVDTLYKVTLARNGNTSWRYLINAAGSATDFSSVGTAGDSTLHIFGGGQDPAFAPANNHQDSMPKMECIAQGRWNRTLSSAEMVALHGSSGGLPVGYAG